MLEGASLNIHKLTSVPIDTLKLRVAASQIHLIYAVPLLKQAGCVQLKQAML